MENNVWLDWVLGGLALLILIGGLLILLSGVREMGDKSGQKDVSPMKLADLSPQTLEKIKTIRWDRIIEKHEGPEDWESVFQYNQPEFMMVDGHPVLLPVDSSHHPNISILRTIWSADGRSLTLFLKDTTYEDDLFMSGYLAVCDKVSGEAFFLAIVYHEWFIID